jgi:ABC-type nitrate/sulfonate/bicarbonate transport system permease component
VTRRFLLPLAGVLGVLVVLELASRLELLPSRHFPPVTGMLARLAEEAQTGDFWTALLDTLRGWAIGFGLAIAIAVPLGLLLGSSAVFYRALRVPVEFLRPVPSVALIPLAILVYGTGLQSKVFLVLYGALWPLLVQTVYGVQDVDPVAKDTARVYRLTRWERISRLTLPTALPYMATGLRISAAIALILAVTAEIVIGAPGLGNAINRAQAGGAVELMYALIIATGLLGWGLNELFVRGERRALRSHPVRGAQ